MKQVRTIGKLLFVFLIFTANKSQAIELETIRYQVLYEERTFIRSETDQRYSLWTETNIGVEKIISELGVPLDLPQLKNGEYFVAFLNDTITEDLTQILYNKSENRIFADYANTGMKLKLRDPGENKKYSHLTIIVMNPKLAVSHLGMRSMVKGMLSQKIE